MNEPSNLIFVCHQGLFPIIKFKSSYGVYLVSLLTEKHLSTFGFQKMIVCGWLLSTALCLSVLLGNFPFMQAESDHPYNRLESSFYISLHRIAWGAGLSWIIFATLYGCGGENLKCAQCGVAQETIKYRLVQMFGNREIGIRLLLSLIRSRYEGNYCDRAENQCWFWHCNRSIIGP